VALRGSTPPTAPAGAPVTAPASSRTGPPWLRRLVLALWLVALATILVVLVSRLLAPATPDRPAHTTTIFYPPGPGGTVVPSVNQVP
jgi:hypothetical protein